MGNVQPDEGRSVCGFDIISSNDLRRSSLQRPQIQRSKVKCHTTIATVSTAIHQGNDVTPSKRDDKSPGFFKRRNGPAGYKRHNTYHLPVKEEKEKHITEQDFRIVQVY